MNRLDSGTLIGGFIIGLIVGSITALFKAPRSGLQVRQQIAQAGEQVRDKLEFAVPADPIAESIAEDEGDYYDGPRYTRFGLNPSMRCVSFWIPDEAKHGG